MTHTVLKAVPDHIIQNDRMQNQNDTMTVITSGKHQDPVLLGVYQLSVYQNPQRYSAS